MIDYKLLDAAKQNYEFTGFSYIETPWVVPGSIANITSPKKYPPDKPVCVASGEQGFLWLIAQGFLAPGKYQTITPCFREDPLSELHRTQFMKLELIQYLGAGTPRQYSDAALLSHLESMISNVEYFVKQYSGITSERVKTRTDETEQEYENIPSYDLEINGVEIGSYGVRHFTSGTWVYGTGLALPRFNIAMNYKQ